ncbi:DUF6000 family protein [Streptomyces sp. NPDC021100]|uniref:DUF6000 family protein n=1 Tax=Streptomyces sp. NPDC021100 TaxID=3365114 RepID=UPI003787AE96
MAGERYGGPLLRERTEWPPGSRLRAVAWMVRADLSGLRSYSASFLHGRIGSREARYRARLIRRYVGHGGRSLHLRGGVLGWPRPRQWVFQRRLRWSAYRATTGDLTALLDTGGWREHLTATWLVAVGRRADLRDRIAQDLQADTPRGYGGNHCTALARLGTDQDALLLRRYLDRVLLLPRPVDESDDRHRPREAMGALLYLDGILGTAHAQPLLTPGGLWERWSGEEGANSSGTVREEAARSVAFAAGRDPLAGTRVR